jgi:hypothetical protein
VSVSGLCLGHQFIFAATMTKQSPCWMIGRAWCRLRARQSGKGARERPHRAAPLLQTASRSQQGVWPNQTAPIVFWRPFWSIEDGEEPRSERHQRYALRVTPAGTCWHLAPPTQLPGREGPIAAHANLPRQMLMLAEWYPNDPMLGPSVPSPSPLSPTRQRRSLS